MTESFRWEISFINPKLRSSKKKWLKGNLTTIDSNIESGYFWNWIPIYKLREENSRRVSEKGFLMYSIVNRMRLFPLISCFSVPLRSLHYGLSITCLHCCDAPALHVTTTRKQWVFISFSFPVSSLITLPLSSVLSISPIPPVTLSVLLFSASLSYHWQFLPVVHWQAARHKPIRFTIKHKIKNESNGARETNIVW